MAIIFSLSAVNASDSDAAQMDNLSIVNEDYGDILTKDPANVYVDDVNGKDSNSGSSDSSLKTINKALSVANDNDNIYLANGEYSGLKNTRLTISKSVNFIGSKNTVINGENENYIFNIPDNVKVTFKNIKFINAYKSPSSYSNTYTDIVYGGVLSINNANVEINNCEFINSSLDSNYDDLYGGAISNFGVLTIKDSYFESNNPISSSNFPSHGGAIYNNGKLSIINTVINSSKSTDGAGIYNDGSVTMKQSIIANSSSLNTGKGSAIYNNGNFTLLNSVIENNFIDQTSATIRGTVFNDGVLTVKGTIFRNNNAKYESNRDYKGTSGVYNNGELNLTNSAFIDNLVFKEVTGDVYNTGDVISLDNNWWGSNDDPNENDYRRIEDVNTWFVFTLTPEYSKLNLTEKVKLTAALKTNLNKAPQADFPLLNVSFTASYNNKILTKELNNGKNTYTFGYSQNKGQYIVSGQIGNFKQSAIIDVGKILTTMSVVTNNNIPYNESLKINITVNDVNKKALKGTVSLRFGEDSYQLNLKNGKANLEIDGLKPGEYELKVVYEGDDNYFKSIYDKTITIKKQSVDLSIRASDVKIGENGEAIITVGPKGIQGQGKFYIDGEYKKYVYLYNGNTTIPLQNFAAGKHNLKVEFMETEKYYSVSANTVFNVNLYDSSLNISAKDINVGKNATIIIKTAPADLRGEAILTINGVNKTIYISGTTTKINLPNLKAGSYSVSVYYDGQSKYYPVQDSTSFNVLKLASKLNVTLTQNKDNITGKIIVKTIPAKCSGNVTVDINFKRYNLTLNKGQAKVNVEFDRGTNYVFVNYEGDDYYSDSNWNTTFGVAGEFVLVGRNSTGWNYNDFDYAIRLTEKSGVPMPNQKVTVTFDGKKHIIVTNDNGLAYYTLNLPTGTYNISAKYGNEVFHNTLTVKNIKFNLTTSNITYGKAEAIEASFESGIEGKVNFFISGVLNKTVKISNNKATCKVSGLNAGSYTVKATYFNDYTSKKLSSKFSVAKATLKMKVKVKDVTATSDEIIYVSNLANATGSVAFTVNGKSYTEKISNSKATLNLSKLATGDYSLTVVYKGNKNYNKATYNTTFYIKGYSTNLLLKVNNAKYGANLIAKATVSKKATGTVRFTVENITKDVEIKEGVASWKFTGINVGKHSISAKYLGDKCYVSASNSTTFSVSKAQSKLVLYTTEVVLKENIMIYGNLSTNATGKVLFSMNGYYSPRYKLIDDSFTHWYISPLTTGSYTVIAVYPGDDNYYGCNTTFILKVTQKRALLDVEINDAGLNDRVTANIIFKSSEGTKLTGDITLKVNSKSYDVYVEKGEATFVLGKMSKGNYTYEATYKGNSKYSKATSSGQFEVKDTRLDACLTAKDVFKYYKGSEKLVVSLSTSKGKAIVGETVTAKINGKKYSEVTDNSGKASFNLDLKSGNYTAQITFKKTETYRAASATAQITVSPTVEGIDVVKLKGSGTQYFAIFADSNGKVLGNTDVKFKIGNKSLSVATLPNGVARLNINIDVGNYTIVAINPVTGEKTTNSLVIFSYLMENKDLTQYYGAGKSYKVRAYDSDGNPVGAGEVVKIKVNKKTYSVKTNKNGYASLKIGLKPGTYTITATYKNYTVSNKVTVKSTLVTKDLSKKKSKTTKYQAKLLDSKGKVLAGKKVTFKFKGKVYTAKTNSNGIATITIKTALKVGKYKIYTSYGKLKVTNTITIKR